MFGAVLPNAVWTCILLAVRALYTQLAWGRWRCAYIDIIPGIGASVDGVCGARVIARKRMSSACVPGVGVHGRQQRCGRAAQQRVLIVAGCFALHHVRHL